MDEVLNKSPSDEDQVQVSRHDVDSLHDPDMDSGEPFYDGDQNQNVKQDQIIDQDQIVEEDQIIDQDQAVNQDQGLGEDNPDSKAEDLVSDVMDTSVLDVEENSVLDPPDGQLKDQSVHQNPEEDLCEGSDQDKEEHQPSTRENEPDQDQDQDQGSPQDQDQDEPQAHADQDQHQEQDQVRLLENVGQDQHQEQDQDELLENTDQDQDQNQDKPQSKICPDLNQNQDQREPQEHTDQDENQDEDPNLDQDPHLDLQTAAKDLGGSVPELVITRAEERPSPAVGPPLSLLDPVDPLRPPGDQVSCSDGGDVTCCDRLSLKSDSISLNSERTTSRTSEEDDSTSVAASSFMSLFHRVQLDPLEREWIKMSAVGNMDAQRRLLAQEPNLVMKKDFVTTALHWAAKQGRQDGVDVMLRSGADVNARSGYTALHLASIHGHQHIVHALINTYKAKTNLRDYHGKTAVQYWSGCTDIFTKQETHPGRRFSQRRWTQRYALPSLLLSRSRSQEQINVNMGTLPQSSSHEVFELQL